MANMDEDQNELTIHDRSADSISLKWNQTNKLKNSYAVKFRSLRQAGNLKIELVNENQIVLRNLKSDTLYEIIITSEESDNIIHRKEVATERSPADDIFEKSRKVSADSNIYQLRTVDKGIWNSVHCLELDLPNANASLYHDCPEKTILLLGEENSGKTTLLDAMMNYIAGVIFSDSRRLKISCGEQCRNVVSHKYRILKQDSFQTQSHLNIIDVSSFNTELDTSFESMLETLTNLGVQTVDAFCLVMPIHYRLKTDANDIVCHIFKNFPLENIFSMITFDDEGCRKVQAIENITHRFSLGRKLTYFRFNSSDLFTITDEPHNWDKQNMSLKLFFDHLVAIKPVNINKTPETIYSYSMRYILSWRSTAVFLLGSIIYSIWHLLKYCARRR